MTTSVTRLARKKDDSGDIAALFWDFTDGRAELGEAERLQQIKAGFSASLFQAIKAAFSLPERSVETLLNASISTLERRRRESRVLDSVASERLDRIATVSHLAEAVLEGREAAARWMSQPNQGLGGEAPIMLCETEIGAKQVRRVLNALEWGGVA